MTKGTKQCQGERGLDLSPLATLTTWEGLFVRRFERQKREERETLISKGPFEFAISKSAILKNAVKRLVK
jgi:hypothetical protein